MTETDHDEDSSAGDDQSKVTSSKLAKKHKLKTDDFLQLCVAKGYLTVDNGKHILTDSGKEQGGEFKYSKRFGPYFIWPELLNVV